MNFNLKAIAFATGLALAAGHAGAAVSLGTGAGNDAELFVVVYDEVSKTSFSKDLGITLGNFLPTPAGSGVTFPGYTTGPINLAADSNWASFLSSSSSSPSFRFLVVAGDTTGGAALNGQRYAITGGAVSPFAGVLNNQVSAKLSGPLVNYVGDINTRSTHATTANGSAVVTDLPENTYNFGNAGALTPTFGGGANITGAVGSSLNFYFGTRTVSGTSASNFVNQGSDLYDNAVGPAKWTLSPNYVLSYTAPVPEPESWALLAAGLALVGSIARRRGATKTRA
jgi:hypothetical protein